MENGPFEDVSPIEDGIFQPAMLVYQRVGEIPNLVKSKSRLFLDSLIIFFYDLFMISL